MSGRSGLDESKSRELWCFPPQRPFLRCEQRQRPFLPRPIHLKPTCIFELGDVKLTSTATISIARMPCLHRARSVPAKPGLQRPGRAGPVPTCAHPRTPSLSELLASTPSNRYITQLLHPYPPPSRPFPPTAVRHQDPRIRICPNSAACVALTEKERGWTEFAVAYRAAAHLPLRLHPHLNECSGPFDNGGRAEFSTSWPLTSRTGSQ